MTSRARSLLSSRLVSSAALTAAVLVGACDAGGREPEVGVQAASLVDSVGAADATLTEAERQAVDRTAEPPTAIARYRARQELVDELVRARADRLRRRGSLDPARLEDIAGRIQQAVVDEQTSMDDERELDRVRIQAARAYEATPADQAVDRATRRHLEALGDSR